MSRQLKRLGALGLAGSLAGVSLLVGATPAFAAGSITDPVDGAVFDRATSFTLRASIDTTTTTELRLQGPGGADQVVDSDRGTVTDGRASLDYAFDTGCVTFPSTSCSGSAPGANGVWTITLRGGASDSRSFTLRIPPATPGGVSASEEGFRAAKVTWRRGSEPDLSGYTLYDNGAVAQDGIGLGSCSGSMCSTTVTYDRDGTGAHAYSLVAKRLAAAGSSQTLSSARSGEASVNLGSPPPPPPPSPTADPTPDSGAGSGSGATPAPSSGSGGSSPTPVTAGANGSGSGPSSSGGGTSGGGSSSGGSSSNGGSSGIGTSSGTSPATAIAQRQAFGLSFSAFGPKLGIPKLPPLPATQPAVAAPLPDGTYENTLGDKDVVTREKVSAPAAAVRRVSDAFSSAVDSERLARSLAGALILLAIAAHLRRWLGDASEH